MRITKEYKFDAAHMLVGHKGKCARLHGHTYNVIVSITSSATAMSGSSEGMVIDYGDLDEIMDPIIHAMDHRMLIKGDEWPYRMVLETLEKVFPGDVQGYVDARGTLDDNFFVIGIRTTAENIAKYIFQRVESALRKYEGLQVTSVTVQETPKTSAVYHGI